MGDYIQLTPSERHRFHAFIEMGYTMTEIARRMNRHRSTLYRELKRNQTAEGYHPHIAQKKTLARKQRPCYIQKNPTLRRYLIGRLKAGWSPEQIVGRLKRKGSKHIVCPETIYRYIYKHNHKLHQYLPYKKPKRRKPYSRKNHKCRYGNHRLITNRPDYVNSRKRIGHWEGDGIEFKGNRNQIIVTLLERKTRFVKLIKVETKSSAVVMRKIYDALNGLPEGMFKSITFDQGSEFSNHSMLEENLNCRVYYCHPHSPWEKGSNENINGRLRRFLPKKADIMLLTEEKISKVEQAVNNTPRKFHGYRTAREVFNIHQYRAREYTKRVCR